MYRWMFVAVALLSLPAHAADFSGKPKIVDGDTLEIAGRTITLYGLDAPEPMQTCRRDRKPWACGREATYALAYETAEHWLRCTERGVDARGRMRASCAVGPHDLGEIMVRKRWALAERTASDMYVEAEAAAQRAGAGLWRGAFEPPWTWGGTLGLLAHMRYNRRTRRRSFKRAEGTMFVREILSKKGAKVFTAHPEDSIETIVAELRARMIGSAVVVDRRGAVQGVLAERDIVDAVARHGAEALTMPAGELMTAPAPTCSPDDDLVTLLSLMTYQRARHVPVVEDGKLRGLISIGDVVKHRLGEIELEVNVLRDYARLTPPRPSSSQRP